MKCIEQISTCSKTVKVFLYSVKMSLKNNFTVLTMVNSISKILNLNTCSSQKEKLLYTCYDYMHSEFCAT